MTKIKFQCVIIHQKQLSAILVILGVFFNYPVKISLGRHEENPSLLITLHIHYFPP